MTPVESGRGGPEPPADGRAGFPEYERRSQVGRLLNRVKSGMEDDLDRILAHLDLTAAQYVVMRILASGRGGSSTEICREIGYDPGAMTRMLDRLEQKGLIRRLFGQGDRRRVKLELTDRGRQVLPEAQDLAVAETERVMGGLSAAELDCLLDTLTRMAQRIEIQR